MTSVLADKHPQATECSQSKHPSSCTTPHGRAFPARRGCLQVLDHVGPIQMVSQLAIIVPCADAAYDSQTSTAVLIARNALCLLHEQRAISLTYGSRLSAAPTASKHAGSCQVTFTYQSLGSLFAGLQSQHSCKPCCRAANSTPSKHLRRMSDPTEDPAPAFPRYSTKAPQAVSQDLRRQLEACLKSLNTAICEARANAYASHPRFPSAGQSMHLVLVLGSVSGVDSHGCTIDMQLAHNAGAYRRQLGL